MARIYFDVNSYEFKKGLESIRDAYGATVAELDRRYLLVIGEGERYRREVEAGLKPDAEWDDDRVLYTYADLYKHQEEEAAAALPIAMQAYVVILHHYWEKWCKRTLCQKQYKAQEAYASLQASGSTVDVDGLENLRKAANAIKHDHELTTPLDDAMMRRLFEAVRASGPDVGSMFDRRQAS